MRMVVTGHQGQVVGSLMERAEGADFEIVTLGRPELDLGGPEAAIIETILGSKPNLIVSAAAYTQVDNAESDRDLAFAVNQRGPSAIARAASELGVPLIHLSTDYVFDGSKASPYAETDDPRPATIYGASKLAGEQAVLSEHADTVVLRTAWVYSPFAANFVKTMLRLAGDRDEVSVVGDQHGDPTSALDLADGILRVGKNLLGEPRSELRGVFHMTGEGEASWAEFAQAIFAQSAELGGPTATVIPITTADYPTAARRPANSRLDTAKLQRTHGVCLPHWHSSLKQVVMRLLSTGQ
jgi:dTDP-4-dehydrorhamnose reductase